MKTVVIILSTFAIAAGIIVGHQEHQTSKKSGGRAEAEAPPGPSDGSSPPGFLAPPPRPRANEKKKRPWRPGEDALVEVPSSEGQGEPPAAEAVEARTLPPPSGEVQVPSPPREKLDAIGKLLEKRDFEGAEKAALAVAEEAALGSPEARDGALRILSKTRILARLILPPAEAPPPPSGSFQEVLLANGLKVLVTSVEDAGGRYVFKLPGGGKFSPPREDVLQIRAADPKDISAAGSKDGPSKAPSGAWKELEPKIARLTHPIDIFVEGVQRCFRLGLEREGLALLDRLMARPDSDQVPLLFVRDAGEEMIREWKVAGARLKPSSGPATAASSGMEGVEGVEASVKEKPAAEPDPEALVRAARLVGEAQALYQSAAGKEGREGDLRLARERLDSALAILEPLPASSEAVKKLRREVAQLLSDVSRQGTF